ncbi:MAG: PadR family transcriptional regulator [Lachnospiraceae bacterium]|nr:PadR family transcriptional regulator [Lachnospiraceae bacterium]
MLKHGILGLLNYADMNGYEILETFRHSLDHFWNAQKSQIYRELAALENAGFIRGTWIEQNGRPDKKMFSITDEGRAELTEWLSEDMKETPRIPLLMKTFFLGERTQEENIAFFEKLKKAYQLKYKGFSAADESREEYGEELQDAYRSMFWGFTISYGRRKAKMLVEWCDECIAKLKEMRNA